MSKPLDDLLDEFRGYATDLDYLESEGYGKDLDRHLAELAEEEAAAREAIHELFDTRNGPQLVRRVQLNSPYGASWRPLRPDLDTFAPKPEAELIVRNGAIGSEYLQHPNYVIEWDALPGVFVAGVPSHWLTTIPTTP